MSYILGKDALARSSLNYTKNKLLQTHLKIALNNISDV